MERSSFTVSSFRSRASRMRLRVGSARAVIWPKSAVGLKWSIRSSGYKVKPLELRCQELPRPRPKWQIEQMKRVPVIFAGLSLLGSCARYPDVVIAAGAIGK